MDAVYGLPASNGRKATQPCKCGYLGSRLRACTCTDGDVARYRGRLSGPLLDRLDLHVEVPSLPFSEISSTAPGEPSAAVALRVAAARELQLQRQGRLNSRLDPSRLRKTITLDAGARRLLEHAVDRRGISGRVHDRVLQVALTIRDLEQGEAGSAKPEVGEVHLAEALAYRVLDREGVPLQEVRATTRGRFDPAFRRARS